jgi:predicted type IV restriction endonuclease
MLTLPLLRYKDKLEVAHHAEETYIRDPIRNKLLVLTPEEMVRQLMIQYLLHEKAVNPSRIAIEKAVTVNRMPRRFDMLIYDMNVHPWMLIECKAPSVELTQEVFNQAAAYNLPLKVPYLLITNGEFTSICRLDHREGTYVFMNGLPDFPS